MRNESEDSIQAAFFQWLGVHEKQFPELALFYAIPNGAHKSIAARMKFKRTGLKPGVPDVHLPMAAQAYGPHLPDYCNGAALWIEFKSAKGRVSDEQKGWHERLRKVGHSVVVCRSWTEAANVTIDYLQLPIKQL